MAQLLTGVANSAATEALQTAQNLLDTARAAAENRGKSLTRRRGVLHHPRERTPARQGRHVYRTEEQ